MSNLNKIHVTVDDDVSDCLCVCVCVWMCQQYYWWNLFISFHLWLHFKFIIEHYILFLFLNIQAVDKWMEVTFTSSFPIISIYESRNSKKKENNTKIKNGLRVIDTRINTNEIHKKKEENIFFSSVKWFFSIWE